MRTEANAPQHAASSPPADIATAHDSDASSDPLPAPARPVDTPAKTRIIGIDVARGIAILGMMGVHMLDPGPFPWFEQMPDNWDQTFRGRSSILFAIIAGISIALMTGRDLPVTGAHLVRARTRILVRAVVIFSMGGFLNMLEHRIAVILEYYGVLFVLALPFLTWRPRRLFQLVAALVAVLPPLYIVISNLVLRSEFGRPTTLTRVVFTGYYPAIVWIIFVLIGLGVGRLDLTSARIQVRLLLSGAVMMIVGYGTGRWAERRFPQTPLEEGEVPGRFDFGRMATTEPHTGTWFEVIGSSGVALMILALCLLVTQRRTGLLYPLAAAGSMALSVYVFHVISMVWIHPTIDTQYQLYLASIAVTLLLASIWSILLGRGPLERALTTLSRRAATAQRPESAPRPG